MKAVVGVDLIVRPGQIIGLVGESGCGKSSVGKVAVGLVAPSAGVVTFKGRPIIPIGSRRRPRDQIGVQIVFQNPFESLNPRRRIGSQVADGLVGSPRHVRRERARKLFAQLSLPDQALSAYPHSFSGGQRQRIAIARALMVSPSILVLDEPLASLDASAQASLANLLLLLAKANNIGILLISHDLSIVRHIADEVYVMYLGVIVESAPTEQLWKMPLHPYSEALIGAIPVADGRGTLPTALQAEVDDPANPPSGCRFHNRCPYVMEVCRTTAPTLANVAPARQVACWLHKDGGVLQSPAHIGAGTWTSRV